MMRRRPPSRRGMTLVELMLALMLTGVIGAAIASMLTAVSYGTDSSRDLRSIVGRNKVLSARLGAAVRSSSMVLDVGDGYLILWKADTDENDLPNLSELERIQFDAVAGTLSSYVAPDDVGDVVYTLTDDFELITSALMGTADFPQELWGTGLSALTLAVDDADPQSARLVSYLVTLQAGDLSDTAIAAVSLRN